MFIYETCLPCLVLEAGSFGRKKLKEQGAYIYNLFFWVHCVFIMASLYIIVYSCFRAALSKEHIYQDVTSCMRRVQDFAWHIGVLGVLGKGPIDLYISARVIMELQLHRLRVARMRETSFSLGILIKGMLISSW